GCAHRPDLPTRRRPASVPSLTCAFTCGRDRRRSDDLALFRRALCRLSYPASLRWEPESADSHRAVQTGLEPATSALTGRRANRTAPLDLAYACCLSKNPPEEVRTPNGIRTRATALKGRRPGP